MHQGKHHGRKRQAGSALRSAPEERPSPNAAATPNVRMPKGERNNGPSSCSVNFYVRVRHNARQRSQYSNKITTGTRSRLTPIPTIQSWCHSRTTPRRRAAAAQLRRCRPRRVRPSAPSRPAAPTDRDCDAVVRSKLPSPASTPVKVSKPTPRVIIRFTRINIDRDKATADRAFRIDGQNTSQRPTHRRQEQDQPQ